MCVIVVVPPERPFTEEEAYECFTFNPDGAGYMFSCDGKLIIRKPFFEFPALWKSLQKDMEENLHSPFVVHFRITTHGENDKMNTHPHPLNRGEVGLVHNGILSEFIPNRKRVSDTRHFVRSVCGQRTSKQLLSKAFNKFLGQTVGGYNKMVLMDGRGKVSIVNEGEGYWAEDRWFSNLAHQSRCGCTKKKMCAECLVASYFEDEKKKWWKEKK